jgi:hypothetical protein
MSKQIYTLDLTTGRGTRLPEPCEALVGELAPRLLDYAARSKDWQPQPLGSLYITAQGVVGHMVIWLWSDADGTDQVAEIHLCKRAKYSAARWSALHDLSEQQLATSKSSPPPSTPWCAYWAEPDALPTVSAVASAWWDL